MPQRTWQLGIQKERTDNVLILSLSGRLGGASAARLRDALPPEGADASAVLIDLGALDYISGPGLAALRDAGADSAANGRPFVVCGLEGSVRIAFELAGVLPGLAVEPTRARGLARIRGI